MNRELKFRAWSLGNRLEGIEPHYIDDFAIDAIYGTPQDIFDGNKSDDGIKCVEQYTGLKDKNGKEIYEGDIIKFLFYRRNCIGKVVFDFVPDSEGYFIEKHYGWGIWCDDEGNASLGDYADDNMRCELVEIIGNVHEPPKDLRPGQLKRLGVSISKGDGK